MNTVDIIIPVYDGYDETVACIGSVLNSKNVVPCEVVVIYDAGPNPRLREYLDELALQGRITLLINQINVGFVATVNKGMALHIDRDVVLLNSDAEVANDWLDRMLACMRGDRRIGTVTPFSNNAEICSFPELCRADALPSGWDVARIDEVFARKVSPAAVDLPTAVGFCMLIARRALKEIGYFDEKQFGRGYGEENDFCRRLAAKGWRNVLCTDVFVAHHGGVSFGAEKQQLVAAAMVKLDRLYPDYHRLVHEFIRADSPARYRAQAMLGMLDTERPRIMVVTHNLDGGTSKHIRELAHHVAGRAYFFIARLCSARHLQLTVDTEWGPLDLHFKWPEQAELFSSTMRALGITKVHIHHIKGAESFIGHLLENESFAYDITLHDYYLINGNPALADKSGQFCIDHAIRDEVCAQHSPVPLGHSAHEWRRFTGMVLAKAQRIFAPSQYAADVFAEYFPALNITVLPHPDWEIDAPYPAVRRKALRPGDKLVVAVLGALGLEKGADILERAAFLATRLDRTVEFHLLGYAYRELNTKLVTVHGAYDDSALDAKLAAIDPHLVWFPCQWPETYSYTLSACLRGGYPVAAPELGAFVERLEGRPLSWLQPFPSLPRAWLETLLEIRERHFEGQVAGTIAWPAQPAARCNYRADYLEPRQVAVPHTEPAELLALLAKLPRASDFVGASSRRERILRVLLRLRQAPPIRICMRFVPFSFQRRVKRALSSRALHQIARDLL